MRYIRNRWGRRDFIRAAGLSAGAATLAPWVPTLSTEAQPSGRPRRLLLLTHGLGSVLERWRDNGSGARFQNNQPLPPLKGPILSPLNPHRERLVLLDGIDIACTLGPPDKRGHLRYPGPLVGHPMASALFTGTNILPRDRRPSDGGSIDQLINDRLSRAHKTLQLTNWGQDPNSYNLYSYSRAAAAMPLVDNPQLVFDDLFRNGFPSSNAESASSATRSQSRSYATLRSQLARLRKELPEAADRERLEHHVEGLANLEARLGVGSAARCTAGPDDRPSINNAHSDPWGALDAQIDIIMHGFACDLVRVAMLQLGPEASNGTPYHLPRWRELGGGNIHDRSHEQHKGSDPVPKQRAIGQMVYWNRVFAEYVASVLDRLQTHGLLDETLVVWMPTMSHGGYHSAQNVPVVIAQGANGPFRTNRYLRWGEYEQPADGTGKVNFLQAYAAGNESSNNLMISLCHAMGIEDVTSFGDPRHCNPKGLDDRLF